MTARSLPLLLAGLALALYLALGQNAMHGLDAYTFLRHAAEGRLHNPQTLLYPPIAWLWARALGALGVPLYEALRALSAAGAAVGVAACAVAAGAFGLDRRRAAMVAAGCASLPAVLDTASVVEIDALLFAAAALAFVPFARLLRGERWRDAALTGLATLFASCLHGAGHLLAAALCGLNVAWGFPRRRPATTLPRSLLLAAVHGAGALSVAAAARSAGQAVQAGNTLALPLSLDFAPHVLWYEWLLPYAPFGVFAFLAARRAGLRAATAGFALCLGGYLLVTTMILGTFRSTGPELPQQDVVERGSFLLGLALPMVLLTVMALPGRWPWLLCAVALASGVLQVRRHDWPADPAGYAEGYAELDRRQPLLVVVADVRELAWIVRRHPRAPTRTVAQIELEAAQRRGPDGAPATAPLFALWFTVQARQQSAAGRTLCVTPRALARMQASANAGLAQAARDLERTHALTPIRAAAFTALCVRPE